jgi:hypothetical protein
MGGISGRSLPPRRSRDFQRNRLSIMLQIINGVSPKNVLKKQKKKENAMPLHYVEDNK